jgi:hypothetical protein
MYRTGESTSHRFVGWATVTLREIAMQRCATTMSWSRIPALLDDTVSLESDARDTAHGRLSGRVRRTDGTWGFAQRVAAIFVTFRPISVSLRAT